MCRDGGKKNEEERRCGKGQSDVDNLYRDIPWVGRHPLKPIGMGLVLQALNRYAWG